MNQLESKKENCYLITVSCWSVKTWKCSTARSFYGIRLVVVTLLKYSIGRGKYINIKIGWIKQQNNPSTLRWVSCFISCAILF